MGVKAIKLMLFACTCTVIHNLRVGWIFFLISNVLKLCNMFTCICTVVRY